MARQFTRRGQAATKKMLAKVKSQLTSTQRKLTNLRKRSAQTNARIPHKMHKRMGHLAEARADIERLKTQITKHEIHIAILQESLEKLQKDIVVLQHRIVWPTKPQAEITTAS